MKAAIIERVNKIVVKNIPTPKCESQSILINVKSCAICGTDVRIFLNGQKNVQFPFTTGHEIAGIVDKIGNDVKNNLAGIKEGDRVVVFPAILCGECEFCQSGRFNLCSNKQSIGYNIPGGFAEYVLVPVYAIRNLIKIPEKLSFNEASITEPVACCINGQKFLDISLGDTVVIIGAGPIGYIHAQLAKYCGAIKVIMVDVLGSKLDLIRNIDPHFVFINSSKENLVKKIMEETNGRGAEKVVVACSSGKAQQEALEIANKGGKVLFFAGLPEGVSTIKLDINLIHYKELSVFGSFASILEQNKVALNLIAHGLIKAKTMISHTFPLFQIVDGINIVKKGKGLKVIINP